ncbi:hypothetical protein GGI42DRAFT_356584 [Trichoderma sp. SZMC 28013]
MPSSPTGPIYNGSGYSTTCKSRITNDRPSHSFGIDRFLADQEQRYPPEFSKSQSPAEAEAIAKAKMTAKLLAFEKQFNSSDKLPGN